MQCIFLNEQFYKDHPHNTYPQIETKINRPYIHLILSYNGESFAVPLKSNVTHPYAYITDKNNHCGVDYSKAVRINNTYIDTTTKPHIRPKEFKKLIGKEFKLQKDFQKYIQIYKDAKNDPNYEHRDEILSFSTLQYFEEYI